MTDLLNCPFCGSESVSQDSTPCTDEADYIWFKCDGCGVESEGEHGRDAALAQWNRRPHAPVSRPAGEGEREAVARLEEMAAWCERGDDGAEGSVLLSASVADEHARDLRSILSLLSPAAPDAGGGEKEALALDQLANAAEVVRRLLHKTKAVQGPSFREAGISFTQAIENARHVLKERDALQSGGER